MTYVVRNPYYIGQYRSDFTDEQIKITPIDTKFTLTFLIIKKQQRFLKFWKAEVLLSRFLLFPTVLDDSEHGFEEETCSDLSQNREIS